MQRANEHRTADPAVLSGRGTVTVRPGNHHRTLTAPAE
jgi:hypothetical protein